MAAEIDIATRTGDLRVSEDDLPTLTDAEIVEFGLPARHAWSDLMRAI